MVIYNYKHFKVADSLQAYRLESKLKSNKEYEEYEEEVKRKKRVEKKILDCIDSVCVSENDTIHNTIRTRGIGRAKHQFT